MYAPGDVVIVFASSPVPLSVGLMSKRAEEGLRRLSHLLCMLSSTLALPRCIDAPS